VNRKQPLVQGNMAIFENRADRRAELLPAGVAVPQAFTAMRLGALFADSWLKPGGFVHDAAVRTHRTFGPALRFEERSRRIIISELRLQNSGFHVEIMSDSC
jgi:hypothetical protein